MKNEANLESVSVILSRPDVELIRSALEELLATYTRHQHVSHQIKDLLSRLPAKERPADAVKTTAKEKWLTL